MRTVSRWLRWQQQPVSRGGWQRSCSILTLMEALWAWFGLAEVWFILGGSVYCREDAQLQDLRWCRRDMYHEHEARVRGEAICKRRHVRGLVAVQPAEGRENTHGTTGMSGSLKEKGAYWVLGIGITQGTELGLKKEEKKVKKVRSGKKVWENSRRQRRKKNSEKVEKAEKGKEGLNSIGFTQRSCYEGERLTNLFQSIRREIRSARDSDGTSLPEKIWLKQQFSIGVNDVTRVLERMKPCTELERSAQLFPLRSTNNKAPSVKLQAVLVASDCNPRWLTKHLLSLASSRSVPLIFVRDNKHGSFRLGELVQLKTAIAIGIKVRS
ncbi:hypothetical protein LR48_Vigan02g152600 [Vigna angularis]|uniref:Ribosomal protein eL8/eL30/eS12/Gadd45 domain-containing protein n=1 Tax=Phaseolus angularis TaxID=3914 RepID=A0A0L9TXZ2_PHAAN|nr:hypothetical protein LR48_Vigan02g152600 [Vigna angularis]